jgi:membrane-bound lytic murein transglycosylase B
VLVLRSPFRFDRSLTLNFRIALVALLVASIPPCLLAQPTASSYLARDEVREFVDEIVRAHEFDRGWVERAFGQARYSEQAEKFTTPALAPPASRNWIEYRARNLEERRVRDGLAFMRQHRATLERAADRYGVPPTILVAVIGVETFYGRVLGNLRTLDVLLTLSFDYTRRASLYREELVQLLLLAREQRVDPLALRGSYAGAVGLPQFMPSSIRRWAVDFDGDGRIDLARSAADAIGSVANFLAVHGWQRGVPVQAPVRADESILEVLGRGGILAQYRWRDVEALGVEIDPAAPKIDGEARVLLLDLPFVQPDGVEGIEYRVGTANATALLNYNRSYFYAMAVAELAAAIGARTSEPATDGNRQPPS